MCSELLSWTLANPNGRPSRCIVQAGTGGYDVIVWTGPSVVLWEHMRSRDEALARADELWVLLVAHGRIPDEEPEQPPSQVFIRVCAECGLRTGALAYVRTQFGVLECANCGFSWNDRIRTAAADRRTGPRAASPDRRAAA